MSGHQRKHALDAIRAQVACSRPGREAPRSPVAPGPGSAGADSGAAASAPGITLTDLIAHWRDAVPDRPRRTVLEMARSARELKAFARARGLDPLQRPTLIAWRDHLAGERGLAPKTIGKKLALIGAALQLAVDDGRLPYNPAARIRIHRPHGAPRSRVPFTVDGLNALFASPVYRRGHRPRGGGGEAAYWLPLLGLFTGLRLEEAAQLRCRDLQVSDGIPYLLITADGHHTRLKTRSSERRIPLHAELLARGLLDYHRHVRAQGADWLFPHLRPDCTGRRGGNWGKWFGRYLRRQVGIDDRRQVFHSLRHGFRQACREAGIEEEMADALLGHAGRSTGRRYGDLYPLRPLAEAMARIRYPGVHLPPPWTVSGSDTAPFRPEQQRQAQEDSA